MSRGEGRLNAREVDLDLRDRDREARARTTVETVAERLANLEVRLEDGRTYRHEAKEIGDVPSCFSTASRRDCDVAGASVRPGIEIRDIGSSLVGQRPAGSHSRSRR